MIKKIRSAAITRFREWWRARLPTREAIVVTALLALIFEGTYLAAFFIRSELLLKGSDAEAILNTIVAVVGIKLLVFYWRGFCHKPWRAARFADLNRLLRAATTCLLVFVALNSFGVYLPGWIQIPRSVLLLDWTFTLLGVGGMQAIARSLHEEIMPTTTVGNQKTVLVIDASPAGRQLAASLGELRPRSYFVAGLLDDEPDTYGLHVGRARVLGPVAMAAACAQRLRASEIIVCEGAIYGATLRELCDACAEINVRVSIAENVCDPELPGGHQPATVKPLKVRALELRDLLSRPQARLEDHDARVYPFLRGRSVLVTGAGGSIGSEICRQLLRFTPAKIVLAERSEASLFAIHQELMQSSSLNDTRLVPTLCDISHIDRAERLFTDHRPEIVIHAAAFKHVPLMESHPIEAIENNSLATVSLAELADAHGVSTFVALSTDKAVHPSSVMGASKLVAERFLQSFGESSPTRFVAVRFGNVIGSSGSAVPIFTEQLKKRLPITITHEDVRRYFMTITEAAQLVLLAGALPGRGGTFVLEMGDPIRIADLVSSLAFVMHIPPEQVRIQYCGLRPGEKLDEELFFEDERQESTSHPLVIRALRAARPLDEVRQWLGELKSAVGGQPETAGQTLMEIVTTDCGGLVPIEERAMKPPVFMP
jgi:FlaA1/EpsC-like NDP-sugar epimerase